MAFTFQINKDVKFTRNEDFLKKAEEHKPAILRKKVAPVEIVELAQDPSKLNGYGVKPSGKKIESLKDCELKRDDALILDFGNHYAGRLSLGIDARGSPMDAPLFIRLRFAEMPAELAYDSRDYNGWLSKSWIQEEYVHLDALPATLNLPRRYSFRYLEIKVVDTSPKWAAVFTSVILTAESAVDLAQAKSPRIEDEALKRIYDVSLKTLADCMQDVFEDGPKRDRRLWLGDLRLQALANYATFDNVTLVKRCLYLFAGMTAEDGRISANVFVNPRVVPDDTFLFEYSLFFISVLYDLNRAHPDVDLVKELYPVAKKQMDVSLGMTDKDGRLATGEKYRVFVDWSNEFNKDTAGQGELIYALKQFIELSEIAGDADLPRYKETLERISGYARNVLYDEEKKLFATGDGEYNIASQVWMALAHVLGDEENREMMKAAIETLFPVRNIATPYMYHHIVEAMFEAGLADEATNLLKEYWGKMIALGADTFWEAFDPDRPDYSPYGSPIVNSYCHAWSCTPVYLMHKYILKA